MNHTQTGSKHAETRMHISVILSDPDGSTSTECGRTTNLLEHFARYASSTLRKVSDAANIGGNPRPVNSRGIDEDRAHFLHSSAVMLPVPRDPGLPSLLAGEIARRLTGMFAQLQDDLSTISPGCSHPALSLEVLASLHSADGSHPELVDRRIVGTARS